MNPGDNQGDISMTMAIPRKKLPPIGIDHGDGSATAAGGDNNSKPRSASSAAAPTFAAASLDAPIPRRKTPTTISLPVDQRSVSVSTINMNGMSGGATNTLSNKNRSNNNMVRRSASSSYTHQAGPSLQHTANNRSTNILQSTATSRHYNPTSNQTTAATMTAAAPDHIATVSETAPDHIQTISETPFVLRIKTQGMMLTSWMSSHHPKKDDEEAEEEKDLGWRGGRSSRGPAPTHHGRNTRGARSTIPRKRPMYLEDTESENEDDFLIVTNKDRSPSSRKSKKKKVRLLHEPPADGEAPTSSSHSVLATTSMISATSEVTQPAAVAASLSSSSAAAATDVVIVDPNAADSPPPGVLSTLWYSRECFLHIFVLEKAVGWKTRAVWELVDSSASAVATTEDGGPAPKSDVQVVAVAAADAIALQQKALQSGRLWTDVRRRMEISRINPTMCPSIMALAAAAAQHGNENHDNNDKSLSRPRLELRLTDQREEVLLVKWRGRSHLHCSWERASDIVRLDPSNNTARNKIRRFYQHQELTLGMDWKKVVEEERATVASIHSHAGSGVDAAGSGNSVTASEQDRDEDTEEYFSPQCLEIERILACDESEMNLEVMQRQRLTNRQEEEERELRAAGPSTDANASATGPRSPGGRGNYASLADWVEILTDKPVWDPEDNVRYVVKWKGLPYAEITWEYWRDIKRDAVDEAEDFWLRQRPPDLTDISLNWSKPHPHIREFRKLQESPTYGVPIVRPGSSSAPAGTLSRSVGDDEDVEINRGFKLRSYQLEGVNWLLFNWWNKRSCILADEMGLGKTIQSAAFLQELRSQPATKIRGPFLIVAPLSLVGQWQSELQSWAPDLNVVLYHGSADARNFLVEQEFYYTDQFVSKATAAKLKKQHITKFHVLITTYEVVLKDIAVLSRIRWRTLIVDEAHRLKNHKSRLFEHLATVPRDYCVLLTGTPIANATEELWSLLYFSNPKEFNDKDAFLEKFGEVTDVKQVNELHTLLKPYLLRRVKEDVEKSLPPKEETILEVSLTPIQKTFYKAIYERNTAFLFKGAKPSNAPSLMNVMMELRKCCNHPYLVKGAEERILVDAAAKLQDKKDEHGNDVLINQAKLFGEQLVKSSGKMVLMEKLLQKLFDGGHKVLIFSQMVRVLDLLEELLKMKNYKYERLDGSTSSSLRAHAVERFSKKSLQRFVMLLSTRAGGLGLNLTAADVVIIFDSDWNPQNDLQAMARAHRIGQTRAVRVYRLLTAKTYEMHMFHSASMKLGLERAVLSQNREQGEENDDCNRSRKNEREAQAKEIDELLKKGAYDVFRDEDDTEAEKFMDTDIDQLLEMSSKKVTYGGAAPDSMGSGLGSFSKASFVASTDDGQKDVDLDDPDFWSKAVGLQPPEEISEEIAQMLDDGVKRSRKQVQVYDPYADTVEAEQRRKERIALEKMLEKEEKERLRMEKAVKRKEAQEKKKREREEQKMLQQAEKAEKKLAAAATSRQVEPIAKEKQVKDSKPSKVSKRSNRLRALRRAQYEDPVFERLKQAWEIPQRNRATAAAMRFGFGRFCKIRIESNLTGLPLQDLECFVRSFMYQLSLQVAVALLARISLDTAADDLRPLFQEWLGLTCTRELDWVCESVHTVITLHLEVENQRRSLRIPVILAEPSYVMELRRGAAFRALRRVGILVRLNRLIEDCLDSILSTLGYEALGRRGCISDLSTLDLDLKSRFVTTEELALAVGSCFRCLHMKGPASWWDRSCDVALVIGSFVHGLGNYESIRNDLDLSFADKLVKVSRCDKACKTASQSFRAAAGAARKVFDDALESARIKAELEVQAAVAAAAKAASQREQDAELLRKGGAEAEAVISSMPDTQVEDAFAYDGTDSHFVTLPRLQKYVQEAVRKEALVQATASVQAFSEILPDPVLSGDDSDSQDDGSGRLREHQYLPMPDSRVLDHRLTCVLKEIENVFYGDEPDAIDTEPNLDLWYKSNDVLSNLEARTQALLLFTRDSADIVTEYSGVGLSGNQCGTSHRSLNDGSDYAFGSASIQLAQIAYGPDAPRYLRALGVPMNVTRYAITGLVHAEASCVQWLLRSENLRFYGTEEGHASLTTEEAIKPLSDGDPACSMDTDNDDAVSFAESNRSQRLNTSSDQELQLTGGLRAQASIQGASADGIKKPIPVDPVEKIPEILRCNAKVRAYVCLAVNYFGFPPRSADSTMVHPDVLQLLATEHGSVDGLSGVLFNVDKFREAVQLLAPDIEVPDAETLHDYVERCLLPHCLRLCVYGNGATTRNARGSHGEYETAFGVSIHPEPTRPHPSPLPDPCISLQDHSLEALGQANAILRRVRLLRSCLNICSGKDIKANLVEEVARSDVMGYLSGLPAWWCPWIHDIALLHQAATGGLFSVIPERSSHPVFSSKPLQQLLYSSFVADEQTLPPAKGTPPEQVTAWMERQARSFPTLNQLEQRLAFLCSHATAGLESESRYDSLPMFDHGGWPRN